MSDTGANKVYALAATGLAPGFDAGNEFGSLGTTTGIVTPIFAGVSAWGRICREPGAWNIGFGGRRGSDRGGIWPTEVAG